jgi:transcriptional regulator with XRE-family HTH domain
MGRPERVLYPGRSALDNFGYELRRLRKERGYSMARLAGMVYVSADLIQKIEVAERRAGRDMAGRLDEILNAGGALLACWEKVKGERSAESAYARGERARKGAPAIEVLCDAVTNYGLGSRTVPFGCDEAPPLNDLEHSLRMTFGSYQQSRYTDAACRAAILLADAQFAVRECEKSERSQASRILALSYQAAASVLTKADVPDLAWVAAERGLGAAESSGDPAVRGSLARSVAFSLLSSGRLEPAMRLVEEAAEFLRRELRRGEVILSVYGTLFLAGSMAAARFGDSATTAEYLSEAEGAARRLGRDANHLWTAFGPTNVSIHRVNTSVELGDIQAAVDSGLSLDTRSMPAERQVRYLLDVARVHVLRGRHDDSLSALLTADQIAPEQVRQHYLARKVVTGLMEHQASPMSPELRGLVVRTNAIESAR